MTYLLAGAVIPGIVLLVFIFKKDKADKEPLDLLLKLLGLGALISLPVIFVGGILDSILQMIFNTGGSGAIYLSGFEYYLYNFIDAFFVVALIEEGFKWLVLYFVTHKNKNFNSLFDGIIYAVFVSLGFAILENIMYVFSSGFETAIMRAITAVPGHMFDGVIMGYYYTLWHAASVSSGIEKYFITKGIIPQGSNAFKPQKLLAFSIIMPVIAHGFYDFCCFVGEGWSIAVFYIFLIGLYIYCFRTINNMSKQDTGNYQYSVLWFIKKYPALQNELIEYMAERQKIAAAQSVYASPYSSGYNTTQQGYTNPAAQGYVNPTGQAYQPPTVQGYSNPANQGYTAPQNQGYNGYNAQGYNAQNHSVPAQNNPPAAPQNTYTPDNSTINSQQ